MTTQADWPKTVLEAARFESDPVADAVVQQIFEKGERTAVNHLLNHLTQNDQILPEALPPEVASYLEATSHLPEWANQELIHLGEEVFATRGPLCLAALIAASLNEGYALANLSGVLSSTQKLETHTTRRILETAQLVIDVMSGGGLASSGRGLRAVQRVRLLHGAIRHLILAENNGASKDCPPREFGDVLLGMSWPIAERGVPICQEDMAFTILAFSYVVTRTLRLLDEHLSEAELDAYVHTWAVVGSLMGVRDDLLPRDHASAKRLFEAIYEHQVGPSEAGILLTQRTVDSFYDLLRTRALPKFLVSRGLPVLIVRSVISERTAEITELTKLSLFQRLVSVPLLYIALILLGGFDWLAHHNHALLLFEKVVSKHLLAHLTALPRASARGLFHVPAHLRARWKVE